MLRAINHECENLQSSFKVKTFWKNFNILDAIGFIDKSWNEVKNSTLNHCWSKLIPQAVIHYVAEPSYEKCVRGLLQLARKIGGDGLMI